MTAHPSEVLADATAAPWIPACDHYCGVHARMIKSLALQQELSQEFGACGFDVTLDLEDGAPVGGEKDHAQMVAELALSARQFAGPVVPRVAVRLHASDHPSFEQDAQIVLGQAGAALCHVMLPKVDTVEQLENALATLAPHLQAAGANALPVHILLESARGISQVQALAAHPRVQSISFGLMDFVSSHGGAIPASAMTVSFESSGDALDQFTHPLVLRAKLEIAAACHAFGKVPAHGVITEFKRLDWVGLAAQRAAKHLGFTRMWSIHPDQIRPILSAMGPDRDEISLASDILCAAHDAQWAPIAVQGRLQDRASYRYFWQVLQRAYRTGRLAVSDPARAFFPH